MTTPTSTDHHQPAYAPGCNVCKEAATHEESLRLLPSGTPVFLYYCTEHWEMLQDSINKALPAISGYIRRDVLAELAADHTVLHADRERD
jgi:hypothetical protein